MLTTTYMCSSGGCVYTRPHLQRARCIMGHVQFVGEAIIKKQTKITLNFQKRATLFSLNLFPKIFREKLNFRMHTLHRMYNNSSTRSPATAVVHDWSHVTVVAVIWVPFKPVSITLSFCCRWHWDQTKASWSSVCFSARTASSCS